MVYSQRPPRSRSPAKWSSTLAKPLAPEEIRERDFVAILYVVAELPSFLWCADTSMLPADEPVRIRLTAGCGGIPLRVRSVCLPFVLVRTPHGDQQTIDVRTCQLARLAPRFARKAWKAHGRS
jgi:hypothetical protein